jgi:hypothetical protein
MEQAEAINSLSSCASAIVTVPGKIYFATMTSGAACFFEILIRVSSAFQKNSDNAFYNRLEIASK